MPNCDTPARPESGSPAIVAQLGAIDRRGVPQPSDRPHFVEARIRAAAEERR
jgi:hypothetical protein